ncbi:hypothetical protein D1BOALGB6SA_6366 [Olavius sp. associated proteobacterium Delta 1]|nr:hypothetical protein D1BOALGB6SA_6366 [Olavius sp. associated proteobacterium Delta 1]
MGQPATRSLYDQLDDRLKDGLVAITHRIESSDQGTPGKKTGDQAIEILESWLMDDEQKRHLEANVWDIFFLYAASSLLPPRHADGANSFAERTVPENISETSLIPEAAKIFWPPFDLADQQQSEILALIGQGYLAASTMAEAIPPRVAYDKENTVNIQFLAACLRLAMGFNLTAPDTLNHLRNLLPPAAAAPQASALSERFTVASTGAHPHVQATILVQVHCRDAEVHRALKRYESYLQRLLYNLNRTVRPRFLFTAVCFEITPQDYRPIDFKFGVDTSSALQLFAGNTLYKDRRVFLRELVQNAVDACNLRQMQEPGFSPSIGIEFSPDLDKITFRDNGIGMSKQWIEKYFLNIGLSFYQSDEITRINRDAKIQFSFISQFGIGFLSSFLVAQQVIMKTRQAGSEGFIITISHIDDYFDVRVVEEKIPVGTEVTVILKENLLQYCRSLEYLGYLKTNVRFLPIALNFVDQKGEHTVLGQESLNYDEEIRWGTKFTTKLDFESSRGYLLLKVKENHEYIFDLESSRGGVSIFQDGIFITQVDYLLPDSAGEHVIGRLNLVGDEKCELSMDRNRLLWKKDQMAQIKKRFLMGLVVIVNRLLETSARQTQPENIRRNIIQKAASFFDFNEVDDSIYDTLNKEICTQVEDQFRRFIRIHHSRYDLLHNPENIASSSHGYINRWQQRVIDGYKEKGAGKVRRS